MKPLFLRLLKKVEEFLHEDSSGHDVAHAQRVFNLALHLQKIEGGNHDVIGIAALVHDILRPWEKNTGKSHFGDEALTIISGVLRDVETPEEILNQVIDVVRLHDVYDWTIKSSNKSLELKIVQDADNLDAMGAIGIGRAFTFGGAYHRPMYIPGENLDFKEDFVDQPRSRGSTIMHFYEKLLKLKDNMNTPSARKMAAKRHKLMEDFLKNFFAEWAGEE